MVNDSILCRGSARAFNSLHPLSLARKPPVWEGVLWATPDEDVSADMEKTELTSNGNTAVGFLMKSIHLEKELVADDSFVKTAERVCERESKRERERGSKVDKRKERFVWTLLRIGISRFYYSNRSSANNSIGKEEGLFKLYYVLGKV
ncbi:hypothetical protein CEXT_473251 [Caerostris extrusa]|uniref:Uncharacterized protein n=1 Tax=Caerostris extrusa TaxID=172846 RepID=A0AAV4S2E9_CAEEX|nr:hypothetical protein CEXT_473251 [Caerostris extrusa]